MSRIVFEEPPPTHKRGQHPTTIREYELAADAAQLAARPGEWARMSTHTTSTVAAGRALAIRTGHLAAFRPAGAFEAVSRTVDGEHRVYARYVGGTPAGGEQA